MPSRKFQAYSIRGTSSESRQGITCRDFERTFEAMYETSFIILDAKTGMPVKHFTQWSIRWTLPRNLAKNEFPRRSRLTAPPSGAGAPAKPPMIEPKEGDWPGGYRRPCPNFPGLHPRSRALCNSDMERPSSTCTTLICQHLPCRPGHACNGMPRREVHQPRRSQQAPCAYDYRAAQVSQRELFQLLNACIAGKGWSRFADKLLASPPAGGLFAPKT